jgi:hypothetical protein
MAFGVQREGRHDRQPCSCYRRKKNRMSEYSTDVSKYAGNVNEAMVAAIVNHRGITLRCTDSALALGRNPEELATVRISFAAKMRGLSADAADAGLKTARETLNGVKRKGRVPFYYVAAEANGAFGKQV